VWAFFVIFFLFHQFARTVFKSVPVILWHRAVSMPLLAPHAYFLPDAKTPPPWFPVIVQRARAVRFPAGRKRRAGVWP
jgi:hypothetical protein